MPDLIKETFPHGWLSLLMIVVLGALGSAAWDIFFKPIALNFRNHILSLLTFWKDSLKNNIYKEISYGSSKQHILIYSSELLFIIFSFIFILSVIFLKNISLDESIKTYNQVVSLGKEINNIGKNNNNEPKLQSKSELLNEYKKLKYDSSKLIENTFWKIILFSVTTALTIGHQISRLIKVYYIQSIICHLDRLLKIIRPHISDAEYLTYQSKYAMIKTKKDFVDLSLLLYKVAEDNNLKYEKFYAW